MNKKVLFAVNLLAVLVLSLAGGTRILAQDGTGPGQAQNENLKSGQIGAPVTADAKAQALRKYLEAQKLEQSGNSPAAIEDYKAAIALDPTAADLRIALGSLYLKNSNLIDAEAQARAALKISPEGIEGRKLLASVYANQTFVGAKFNKDKAKDAITELEGVAKSTPEAKVVWGGQDVPVLLVVGSLYESLDDNDKALAAFKRMTSADASSDVAYYAVARIYFDKNKFREAAEAAKKAYDISPKPGYADLLARSYLRTERTQEALDLYKKTLGLDEKDKDDTKAGLRHTAMIFDYAEALVNAG
ncbi:MAG TPA: tetratricopeptide repeat protein, partial [Blastocatellia bacterium]